MFGRYFKSGEWIVAWKKGERGNGTSEETERVCGLVIIRGVIGKPHIEHSMLV